MVRSPSGLLSIIMVGLPSYPSINTAKRMNGIKGFASSAQASGSDAINDFLLDRLNFYNRMMMKAQCRDSYRGDITAREPET